MDKENEAPALCDKTDSEPLPKWPKLPCKKKVLSENVVERFANPVDDATLEKAIGGLNPVNTETSTRWAVKNFATWTNNRRKLVPNDPVHEDLLECRDHTMVCKYLCLFILETRKEDGAPYPPATLKSLLGGLNRVFQKNRAPFSILDKRNENFRDLFNTLDWSGVPCIA